MKKLLTAALLGATLLTAPALAQDPAPRPMRADANADGVVTRDEAMAAAAARFAAADADKDGRLTAEERRAARPHRGRHGRHPGMMLERADANRDGVITRAEASAAADARFAARDAREGDRAKRAPTQAQVRERALKLFDRVDTNRDGRVDAREREAFKLEMRARAPGGDAAPRQR